MFTKDLSTLTDNIFEKAQKMKDRMEGLRIEIAGINDSIQEKLRQLMEAELEGNIPEQTRCKKEIRKCKEERSELEELADVIQQQLQKGILSDKEIAKIRNAVQKEFEAVGVKRAKLNAEKEQVEQQIYSLTEHLKQIEQSYFPLDSADNQATQKIRSMLPYINPKANSLAYHGDRDTFIKLWIKGESTDFLFESKPEPKGFTYTEYSSDIDHLITGSDELHGIIG